MTKEIIVRYLNYCKNQRKLSENTLRAYKFDLEQYNNGEFVSLEMYLEWLNNRYNNMKTFKRKIATIKAFYNYMEVQGHIKYNPAKKIRLRYKKENELPHIITAKDIEKLLIYFSDKYINSETMYSKKIAHRNLLIVRLLMSTGMRVSEICNIRVENIFIESKKIIINGKGKKERNIYIGDEFTLNLLNEYLFKYHKKGYVYLFVGSTNGKCISTQTVRLFIRKAKTVLGIRNTITPHMFRHTFATFLLEQNVDIRYIQDILGHSSIAVTQLYTHVSQRKKCEIMTKYNPFNITM